MTEEQKAAYIIGESVVLLARVLGMFSENMERHRKGQEIAYPMTAFETEIEHSPVHHNASIGFFHST